MRIQANHIFLVMLIIISAGNLFGQNRSSVNEIIVDQHGKGQFTTIQGAVNSLPDSAQQPRIIRIRNGSYHEKLYIEKPNITFIGESRDSTIIQFSIARDEWRCGHNDDWGTATLNIGANDITLKNLTISNPYGFDNGDRTVFCANDTTKSRTKLVRKSSHQMALRTMNGATRLRAFNCRFRSFGGDTVSPWEVEYGLWYFNNCIMEGGVDLYCPRGWAWAENCTFIVHSGSAAIWHDGSKNPDAKSVLKNCRFTGFEGFSLGRYHRDAQMYLVDCVFAREMRDTAIYRVQAPNPVLWGHRVYYNGCKRQGTNDFTWYKDQLPEGLNVKDITVEWVFGKRWNPLID